MRKRKLAGVAFAAFVCLAATPALAFAEDHSHPVCGDSHAEVGPHAPVCQDVAWTLWEDSASMPQESGSYYLGADVVLSSTWTVPSGETSLCLNGKTISGNDSVQVIHVPEGSIFNLCDCGSAHSGAITDGRACDEDPAGYNAGGGVGVNGGTFNMYGGSITDNVSEDYQAGGVNVYGGTFNMYGGSISNNSAYGTFGGGVHVQVKYTPQGVVPSTFNMVAGEIVGNSSYTTGGGVSLVGSQSSFIMSGGLVAGNSSSNGSEISLDQGTVQLSGGQVIGGSDPNCEGVLFIASGSKFELSHSPEIGGGYVFLNKNHATGAVGRFIVSGALSDGASVPASNLAAGGVLAVGTDSYALTESDAAKFQAGEGTRVVLDPRNNRLVICEGQSHPGYENGFCTSCGVEHDHSFAYSSDGDAIRESCSEGCGHEASAILGLTESASLVYCGAPIEPLTVAYSDNWHGGSLQVDYADNVVPGTATGSISIGGVSASKSFEIEKANLTLSLGGSVSKVYDGTTDVPDQDGLQILISGIQGADMVWVDFASAAYDSADAGTTGVTLSGLTLAGDCAEYYKLSDTTVSGNVGMIERSDGLLKTESVEAVEGVTPENVTMDDRDALEAAREDLQEQLADADNFTEQGLAGIQAEIDRIDGALEVIEQVQAVEDMIFGLPEEITKEDQAAVESANEAFDALSDYQKSLVSDDAKKALEDANKALEEPKAIDAIKALVAGDERAAAATGDSTMFGAIVPMVAALVAALTALVLALRKRK